MNVKKDQENKDQDLTSFSKQLRIEICGGIASGKTTLASLIENLSIEAIFENFQINPFWQVFYQNPQKYAFETEITFLLQHYHQIKSKYPLSSNIVCDYSLILDLAYAKITLKKSQLLTFLSVFQEVKQELGFPSLLIYLQCSADAELERIRQRGRAIEQTINISFLAQLNQSIQECIQEISHETKIFIIDSEHQDFANNELVQLSVYNSIQDILLL